MSGNFKRILLIEDDGSMAESISNALIDQGPYHVTNAYGYISALGQWYEQEDEFDCIILDMNIDVFGVKSQDDLQKINDFYPLIGVAFLDKILKDKSDDEMKLILGKTIIYSGYTLKLKQMAYKIDWDINDTIMLPKNPNSINILIKKVNHICHK